MGDNTLQGSYKNLPYILQCERHTGATPMEQRLTPCPERLKQRTAEISIKQDYYSTSVCHKVTFCRIYIISYGSDNFTSAS